MDDEVRPGMRVIAGLPKADFDALLAEIKGAKLARPRQRKPTLDKLIAKAKAAGATSVMVEGVEMRFGEPGSAPTSSNPWDEVLSRDTH
jgi:hypothetical protein